jgi:hypothetical protein
VGLHVTICVQVNKRPHASSFAHATTSQAIFVQPDSDPEYAHTEIDDKDWSHDTEREESTDVENPVSKSDGLTRLNRPTNPAATQQVSLGHAPSTKPRKRRRKELQVRPSTGVKGVYQKGSSKCASFSLAHGSMCTLVIACTNLLPYGHII